MSSCEHLHTYDEAFSVDQMMSILVSITVHKMVCCEYEYLLKSPWQGNSNRYPQHKMFWRNIKIIPK